MSDPIPMHVGELLPREVRLILESMPLDMTFVDENRIVRWYSPYRLFKRRPEDIGKDVIMCHSLATRGNVDRLMSEFESGWRDSAEFLTHSDAGETSVRYLALRDAEGVYRGTLEIAVLIADLVPPTARPAGEVAE